MPLPEIIISFAIFSIGIIIMTYGIGFLFDKAKSLFKKSAKQKAIENAKKYEEIIHCSVCNKTIDANVDICISDKFYCIKCWTELLEQTNHYIENDIKNVSKE